MVQRHHEHSSVQTRLKNPLVSCTFFEGGCASPRDLLLLNTWTAAIPLGAVVQSWISFTLGLTVSVFL